MGFIELFILAIGISMDAFAVSVCKGLAVFNLKKSQVLIAGLWFGGFQALMPLIGYFLGVAFEQYVTAADHYIAFLLLSIIGFNMIKEAFSKKENSFNGSFSFETMLIMAVATSIDALAVGITFAFIPDVNIIAAVSFIGITTFILSAVGVKIGNAFGTRFKSKAEFTGGLILIILGVKILLEHLNII